MFNELRHPLAKQRHIGRLSQAGVGTATVDRVLNSRLPVREAMPIANRAGGIALPPQLKASLDKTAADLGVEALQLMA